MSNRVAAFQQTVTIAATAGTVTLDENCAVTEVWVAPNGSVSAANAALKRVVSGNAVDIVASEAVSTSTSYQLFSANDDGGIRYCTVATPLRVVFDTATNDDLFDVTFICVR